MRQHHNHHCSTVDLTINRQVGPHSSLYCRSCDSIELAGHPCNSVEQTISRQVGPNSTLFCRECHMEYESARTECGPVEQAISRQVGLHSPLYCRSCEVQLTPSGRSNPAEEAICRIAGPRSSLCLR